MAAGNIPVSGLPWGWDTKKLDRHAVPTLTETGMGLILGMIKRDEVGFVRQVPSGFGRERGG